MKKELINEIRNNMARLNRFGLAYYQTKRVAGKDKILVGLPTTRFT